MIGCEKGVKLMIFGAHVVVYSKEATADRAFFREVFGFSSVDAGHGWLIFALPPAELAVHPTEGDSRHELYLMCDDLEPTMAELTAKGVQCGPVSEHRWGRVTSAPLPGGAEVRPYEPSH